MKSIHIIAGGPLKNPHFNKTQLKKADEIICADGGANHAKDLGIRPDYIIGDLDSITTQTQSYFQQKTTIINDPNQEKTDLELALQLALQNKADQIIIHCAIGERLDHTLANLLTLNQIPPEVKGQIIEENTTISLIKDKASINKKNGETISIIPLEPLKGLSYKGLKWDVNNLQTTTGWFGISNRITEEKATIQLTKGCLLLIQIKEK